MKTLHWYMTKNIAVTALMALCILMFVMLSGQLFRLFDELSRGVSPLVLAKGILYLMPDMLRFTLPLSLLISTVLVFSRLSADNEVVAMRAMGISLWQIISPALMLAFLFSLVCFWVSLFVAPEMRDKSERLLAEEMAKMPLSMLEVGVFSEIGDQDSRQSLQLMAAEREGTELKGIHILMRERKDKKRGGQDGRQSNADVVDITAARGRVVVHAEEQSLELVLTDAEVTSFVWTAEGEKPTLEKTYFLKSPSLSVPIKSSSKRFLRKLKYLNLKELCARMVVDSQEGKPISEHLTTLHQKLALALAPFSFFLIGLPFGIRSKRSELSIGLLVCVLLAVVFYAFIMLANAVKGVSWLLPQYILWIPNLAYQFFGVLMIRRLEHF